MEIPKNHLMPLWSYFLPGVVFAIPAAAWSAGLAASARTRRAAYVLCVVLALVVVAFSVFMMDLPIRGRGTGGLIRGPDLRRVWTLMSGQERWRARAEIGALTFAIVVPAAVGGAWVGRKRVEGE